MASQRPKSSIGTVGIWLGSTTSWNIEASLGGSAGGCHHTETIQLTKRKFSPVFKMLAAVGGNEKFLFLYLKQSPFSLCLPVPTT
jgi:hypothetical protein